MTKTSRRNYPPIRKYGNTPYRVAVIHGGPGAPGYMATVARELSKDRGVIEPLQSKDSLDGQIEELESQLIEYADSPSAMVGSSWGAVLSLFVAARRRVKLDKIILIGSAVFDRDSSTKIDSIRQSRWPDEQRLEYEKIKLKLAKATPEEQEHIAGKWADAFDVTDKYDPIEAEDETLDVQYDLHKKVFSDFVALRDTPGLLKKIFSEINIPVAVIHGDYDPHPIEGIRPFLESCIDDIHFNILEKCGHYPWLERYAREDFYILLRKELGIKA
ncbi:MAG: alpha/beta hydrolase [candidate division Zixibacteria bacterium]|nr:alpha/beta hydrolase [candidate division Zixibacteria bacterium]